MRCNRRHSRPCFLRVRTPPRTPNRHVSMPINFFFSKRGEAESRCQVTKGTAPRASNERGDARLSCLSWQLIGRAAKRRLLLIPRYLCRIAKWRPAIGRGQVSADRDVRPVPRFFNRLSDGGATGPPRARRSKTAGVSSRSRLVPRCHTN